MKKKQAYTFIIIGILVVIYFTFCTVLTPFTRGKVIDAQTGKPIENAWIIATVDKGVRTIAGDVGSTRMISSAHTRTNKNGRFFIPPRLYFSIPAPVAFGMTAERFIVIVRVNDGRRARVDLSKHLWKWWFSTTIPVTLIEMKQEDRFRELQDLYRYCNEGSFLLVVPQNPIGCDKWELDYVIAEHEKILRQLGNPVNTSDDSQFVSMAGELAILYKQQGNYTRAIELFTAARDIEKKYGIDLSGYERKIGELKQRLLDK